MPAGKGPEALLRVVDQLCAELAPAGIRAPAGGDSRLNEYEGMAGILGVKDELLVSDLRSRLAAIAAAITPHGEDAPPKGLMAALDGAELVIRGELISGNREQLPRLMPSIVYMVALPIVDQDRALELSRRTEELIEAEPRL